MGIVAVFRRIQWSAVVGVGVVVGLCLAILAPSGASAATIGSDLKGSPDPGAGYSCGTVFPTCAVQQLELPGNKTRAPFSGVIRGWRFRTVFDPEPGGWKMRLRVVRKTGPGEFRWVRKSKPGLVKKPGRHRFKAHLRIRKGDFIALQLPGQGNPNIRGFYVQRAGAESAAWFPAPANGEGGPPTDADSNLEFLYNATIKRRR